MICCLHCMGNRQSTRALDATAYCSNPKPVVTVVRQRDAVLRAYCVVCAKDTRLIISITGSFKHGFGCDLVNACAHYSRNTRAGIVLQGDSNWCNLVDHELRWRASSNVRLFGPIPSDWTAAAVGRNQIHYQLHSVHNIQHRRKKKINGSRFHESKTKTNSARILLIIAIPSYHEPWNLRRPKRIDSTNQHIFSTPINFALPSDFVFIATRWDFYPLGVIFIPTQTTSP